MFTFGEIFILFILFGIIQIQSDNDILIAFKQEDVKLELTIVQ